ncbi:MAG: glycosyltransferase family 9 protein, partial [Burkholderiaceae bacterium]|nr:glycosyltransferase family 9 protein [Burkholderiaceae bacterium]
EEKHNWWKKKCALHTVEVDYFGQHVIAEKLRLLLPFTSEKNLFEGSSGVRVLPPAIVPLPEWLSSQLKQDFVVIHPSPLTAYKRWPLFHWVQLIEHLSSKYQVILSGAPIAQDLELNAEIMSQLSEGARSQVLNLEGRLALNQLGTLLRSARLYIGVDTSVTHLAAACDIPTITLFGATPPTNFGPWPNGFKGDQPYQLRGTQKVGLVTIVQGPGDCVPCRKAGCEDRADSKSECLMNLSVAQVIEAIEASRPID